MELNAQYTTYMVMINTKDNLGHTCLGRRAKRDLYVGGKASVASYYKTLVSSFGNICNKTKSGKKKYLIFLKVLLS